MISDLELAAKAYLAAEQCLNKLAEMVRKEKLTKDISNEIRDKARGILSSMEELERRRARNLKEE